MMETARTMRTLVFSVCFGAAVATFAGCGGEDTAPPLPSADQFQQDQAKQQDIHAKEYGGAQSK